MVVFSLSSAPQRVRGLLSRYCLEIRPGLFVGRLDARMRRKLWAAVREGATAKTSAAVAWARPSAQGFAIRTLGPNARQVTTMDGLYMVVQPPAGTDTPSSPDSDSPDAA